MSEQFNDSRLDTGMTRIYQIGFRRRNEEPLPECIRLYRAQSFLEYHRKYRLTTPPNHEPFLFADVTVELREDEVDERIGMSAYHRVWAVAPWLRERLRDEPETVVGTERDPETGRVVTTIYERA